MMWLYSRLHAAVAFIANPSLAWASDLRKHPGANLAMSFRLLITLIFMIYVAIYYIPVYFDALQIYLTALVVALFFVGSFVFYLTLLRDISGLFMHYVMVTACVVSSVYLSFNILYSTIHLRSIELTLFFVPWLAPLFLDIISRFRPCSSYVLMAFPTASTVFGLAHYLIATGFVPSRASDTFYVSIIAGTLITFLLFCLNAFLRTYYLDLRLQAERSAVLAMELSDRLRMEGELSEVRYQLERLSRNLVASALAVSISHEINQPLTAINTNAAAGIRFLKRKEMDEVGECLTAVEQSAHRAGAIVNGIRGLLRRNTPAFHSFQPNEMLRETLDLMRLEAKQRQLILVEHLDANLPPITGDRIRLQQVCINLITNAMDAMQDTPHKQRYIVVRSTALNAGEISIQVADRGCGIPVAERERIFEPFYSTKDAGTGIGLSISKSIIDAHDGQMLVRSDTGGTEITLLLPVLPDVESKATA